MADAGTLGLIAGDGSLPGEIARAVRASGRRVHAFGFRGITRPELADAVDQLDWFVLGQVEAILAALGEARLREAVLAGKVSKTVLLRGGPSDVPFEPDARALAALAPLDDRRDDSVLGLVARILSEAGVSLLPQADLVPDLVPGPGPLGGRRADRAQLADAAFGWRMAKQIAGLDIGQCVVVRAGAVLAVEAIEGTDAAIRRAGALAEPGAVVVKVAKPDQDPRFDLPALGPGTLDSAIAARVALVAFEAGRTLVLDRAELVRKADAGGVAVVGFSSAGPDASEPGGGAESGTCRSE